MNSLMKSWKYIAESRNMYEKIIFILPNTYIYGILSNYLLSQEKNSKFFTDYSSNNEIFIKRKDNDDIFHIKVTPSLDNIENVYIFIGNEENHEELTYKIKEDNKIIVESRKVNVKRGPSNKLYHTVTEVKRQTYIDYELRYEYDLCVNNDVNSLNNDTSTTLTETYIDLDKWAVRRKTIIREDSEEPIITLYTETDNYSSERFDNIGKSRLFYSINNDMRPSTKERFEEAINGSNNVVSLKK